ncbi:adenosine 5'-monophosphoramidase HINT3 isoform X3 [Calonectris borealis]|uniref:adenosine 5'-monophosphoramidase HINT3 isoform X3 n=1 Tax=Calonectris borealis TaxID=1323832 RepID=UPI003F4C6835
MEVGAKHWSGRERRGILRWWHNSQKPESRHRGVLTAEGQLRTQIVLASLSYEDLVCFRDIRPDAPHHYLVVPVEHMQNCKTLKTEHIPIVKRMMEVGKAVLQRNNFSDLNDVRMGFHWPPFCSISHLHLHVLAPASQLGFLSRLLYRINSYWFITAEQLIERLQTENAAS